MTNLKRIIKTFFRPYRDFSYLVFGQLYDFYRYARHAGFHHYISDSERRNYKAVKIYHRLEKSLSFRIRNAASGKSAAEELRTLLKRGANHGSLGYQECVAYNVLAAFNKQAAADREHGNEINESRIPWPEISRNVGGVKRKTRKDLEAGRLEDPEVFFLSRYSVRDFSSVPVARESIVRAVELALKTPSVCNRQGWFVYHTDDRRIIEKCLSFQNGNRGFGHEIPSLLIIASDLKAFDAAGERYQNWIDGGMFSMSIVYALHALGIGSCCLNWSKTPGDDLKFRKCMPIAPHHNVIMMLAVGFPREHIKVCYSARRPIDSVYEYWS